MNKYIATYGLSNDSGIGITAIEHGIEDYIHYNLISDDKIIASDISIINYHNNGEAYFMVKDIEIPLNECIKTDI